MGPDCGTAVVGGVALGFANVVRPGSVGIVAASGTGRPAGDVPPRRTPASASATASVSAAATCQAEVKGRSTRQALAALAADEATDVRPRRLQAPGRRGARGHAGVCRGAGRAGPLGGCSAQDGPTSPPPSRPPCVPTDTRCRRGRSRTTDQEPVKAGALRGLFCGGTLADEAMLDRERDARRHPLQHPALRDLAPRRRPARRRPRRHRLRRRHADPAGGPTR